MESTRGDTGIPISRTLDFSNLPISRSSRFFERIFVSIRGQWRNRDSTVFSLNKKEGDPASLDTYPGSDVSYQTVLNTREQFRFFFLYHRRGLRSIMALLPLLGITYLVGFFAEFHIAVAYVFVLLNSTQVCYKNNNLSM